MNQLGGFPLLTLIIWLPAVGALTVALLPAHRRDAWRWLSFLLATTVLFISLFLYMGWDSRPQVSLQFADGPIAWAPRLNVRYHHAIDGLNLHLVMLTTLLMPILLLSTWPSADKRQTVAALVFETGMLSALTTFDLTSFWIGWMIVVVSVLASLALAPSRPRLSLAAARMLLVLAAAAPLLLVVAIILTTRASTGSLADLPTQTLDWGTQVGLFIAVAVAMGLTAAAFPLHLGQVAACRHADPALRLMIGVLLVNLGGYGLIRLGVTLFPLAAISLAPAMLLLGAGGLLYGGLAALGARSQDEALAWRNISLFGLVIIGISSGQNLGLQGAITLMVGQGLSAAVLWLIPHLAGGARAHKLALLSAIGLPGLAVFPGLAEMMLDILRWRWQFSQTAAINQAADWAWYALIVAGLLMGTWVVARTPPQTSSPPPARRIWVAVPLLAAILVWGLFPKPIADSIGPAVHQTIIKGQQNIRQSLQLMGNELPSEPTAESEGQ